jgi:hypothetical protein
MAPSLPLAKSHIINAPNSSKNAAFAIGRNYLLSPLISSATLSTIRAITNPAQVNATPVPAGCGVVPT